MKKILKYVPILLGLIITSFALAGLFNLAKLLPVGYLLSSMGALLLVGCFYEKSEKDESFPIIPVTIILSLYSLANLFMLFSTVL